MPGNGPRAKNWCFTLNNYTETDLDQLSQPLKDVEYLIYGKAVGASGIPYLQGSVRFQSRKRLPQVVGIIGQAHCTVTSYLKESIAYCKKDGDFIEVGTNPTLEKTTDKK